MLHAVAVVSTLLLLAGFAFLIARLDKQRARALWLACFTLVIAGGVTMMIAHSFINRWGIRTNAQRDGLWSMMDGTAERPFVFRRLAPDIVRLGTDFTEARLPPAKVDAFLKTSTLLTIFQPEPLTRRESIAIHIAYALVWLALLATVVSGAGLLRSVRACSWLEGLVAATLSICLLPVTLSNGGYIYDSLEILLWTVLVLVISKRWLVLVPAVFVALLINKESALAAVPALFPLFAWHLGKRNAGIWIALLAVAASGWLFFVRHRYAGCGGIDQDWSLWSNLQFWGRPASFFKFAAMFSPALPAPRGGNLAILFLLIVPLRFGWAHLRADLRQATAVAALILLPLFLLSGCIDETRALGPLFPFLFVACSEGISQLFKGDFANLSKVRDE